MLHVAVICLACRGQKYATMVTPLYLMKCFGVEICINAGTDPDFFFKRGLGLGLVKILEKLHVYLSYKHNYIHVHTCIVEIHVSYITLSRSNIF